MTKTKLIKKWNKEIEALEAKIENNELNLSQRGAILFQMITLENCINDLRKLKSIL